MRQELVSRRRRSRQFRRSRRLTVHGNRRKGMTRHVILWVILLTAVVAGSSVAWGGEIIPSLGITRTIDTEDNELYAGLAFRGDLTTFLQGEVGAMYRSETLVNDSVHRRMWPIMASLWLAPVPMLYAGGGVGWYHTTIDYDSDLPIEDDTSQDFGVHLGGGMKVPLGPGAAVDLNGHYAFLDDVKSEFDELDNLDADFWTLSLGLAIKL